VLLLAVAFVDQLKVVSIADGDTFADRGVDVDAVDRDRNGRAVRNANVGGRSMNAEMPKAGMAGCTRSAASKTGSEAR
jgi:endonuclease YncB( thermonuclease family)